MKILYLLSHNNKDVQKNEIDELSDQAAHQITFVDHRGELNATRRYSPLELDELYRCEDPVLMRFYDRIQALCDDHQILICNHENALHPEFVRKLKNIYRVIVSGDDPEASFICSQPYLYAFDHAFAWGVYYNDEFKVSEMFKAWGAKNAGYWPVGVMKSRYRYGVSEEEVFKHKRDIDIIYVGGFYLPKQDRLMKLKRRYGKRFQIFGNWGNARGFLRRLKDYRLWLPIRPVTDDEMLDFYGRSKIGFNLHMSYGPSNVRLFQLPANGVMQICDCKGKGLEEVYEEGREVVGYHSFDEACRLIDYYLDHPDERETIARRGYQRTMRDYRMVDVFLRKMEEIQRYM